MNLKQYIIDYFMGQLPLDLTVLNTLILLVIGVFFAGLLRRFRKKKTVRVSGHIDSEVVEQLVKPSKPDTPYVDGAVLPHGDPFVYFLRNIRDWFMRYFYYNTITVIRLKKTGKADHRVYLLKPIQQETINWDNCTYNVVSKSLILVRKSYLMLVIEGVSEPVHIWEWESALKLVQSNVNRESYDKWNQEEKEIYGKFDFDAYYFYNKMNNRDAEIMGQTGIPNMQLMYYATIVSAAGVLLIVLSFYGVLGNSLTDRLDLLKSGLVEIMKRLPAGG